MFSRLVTDRNNKDYTRNLAYVAENGPKQYSLAKPAYLLHIQF